VTRASAVAVALDHVSFFAEAGAKNGPCKRLLRLLDHTTTAASARALAFANHPPTTTAKDVSSRGAIEAAATRVTTGFGAVEH
jgi:hypothetical protein